MSYKIVFSDETMRLVSDAIGEAPVEKLDENGHYILEAHLSEDDARELAEEWNRTSEEDDAEGLPVELRLMLAEPVGRVEVEPETAESAA